jgi:hypothetical protein
MGTNWQEIIERVSVWMGPAISAVVVRAQVHTSASMVEHGVGHDTVYELCNTRRWHGYFAGQFSEPIRMLRQAAADMEELVKATSEHLQALAPVYRHQGQGALPKSIRDVMDNVQEAWGCFIEWHGFLCAVRLAVVWSEADTSTLHCLTGGQNPGQYFLDNYAKNPAFGRLPLVGPGVNRRNAFRLREWLYDLWDADAFEIL